MPDLLLELGVEEIPASYVAPALAAGEQALRAMFATAQLVHGAVTIAATPRRLCWHIAALSTQAHDREELVIGPPESRAFDQQGQPTPAAIGFAARLGLTPAQLTLAGDIPNKTGRYLVAHRRLPGAVTHELLLAELPAIVRGLPFPRSMHWLVQAPCLTFCRPIRSLVCLFGSELIPVVLAETLAADRVSHGHAFLAPAPIELADASWPRYVESLARARVVVDPERRRVAIREQLISHTARWSEQLLDEVVHLVELPTVIRGEFDPSYLELPSGVLVEAMTRHQRYFPVYDAAGQLQPAFLTVANRPADHAERIRRGNERVLRARLADARYFYERDLATPIMHFQQRLASVVYHGRLGSMAARCERLERLAAQLSTMVGHHELRAHAARAGLLAKFDLVSEVVGEFDALAGTMGSIYAKHAGETATVVDALAQHVLPRQHDDPLPQQPVAIVLALADRLDHLIGLFAAGEAPRGSGDPYGLRRAALGVIRLLAHHRYTLSLRAALAAAASHYPIELSASNQIEAVATFIAQRQRQLLLEQGQPHDLVSAVFAAGCDDPADIQTRLEALIALRTTAWWNELVVTVERSYNIHKQVAAIPHSVDPSRLTAPIERELAERCAASSERLAQLADARDWLTFAHSYHEAFSALVGRFFTEVFVNDPDPCIRGNRLALLRDVSETFRSRLADISTLSESR
jgi:tetrameric-type glycyl-tRNA synthetase beta subunit